MVETTELWHLLEYTLGLDEGVQAVRTAIPAEDIQSRGTQDENKNIGGQIFKALAFAEEADFS
jgi:hypothetical protein